MSFTAEEISTAGKAALDFYQKNELTDNYNTERPLLNMLRKAQKTFPGGKQYVTEQIRKSNSSNFQWYRGSQVVTYNKRKNIEQSQYEWGSAHDGFALDEDRLAQNGIMIHEGKGGNASKAEAIQLTNLLDEEIDALNAGFDEKFDQALHLDGTQATDAIVGLDAIIASAPTTGTVGGINSATNPWWRNHAATGLTTTTTTGTIWDSMVTAWRACIRNGGRPDAIIVGSTFLDGFRQFMMKTHGRIEYGPMTVKSVEGGTGHKEGVATGLYFNGIELEWDPGFEDLDSLYAPAIPWVKRCYFINSKYFRLRPMEGQDMVTRKPPRAYDKYEYYWGLTWKGAVTCNRRNAHAFLSLA